MEPGDLESAREKHAAALDRNLNSLLAQLRAIPEVQRVILFGSYASGRRDLLTELDLFVVMESQLDFVSRSVDMARRIHADVALDLLVYTPEEFKQVRDRPFFRHAL